MRKSLLLFLLLVALSAGLLAGACAAVQGRRETVSYRTEPLAGDPTAADGVELTWESTCGYHLEAHRPSAGRLSRRRAGGGRNPLFLLRPEAELDH